LYLHHFISVPPHQNTCSSSVVTISRLSSSLSLRITDLFFIMLHLIFGINFLFLSDNFVPISLPQTVCDLPSHGSSSPSINSPLSLSITPSLFHFRLKAYLFLKSFPPQTFPFYRTDFMDS